MKSLPNGVKENVLVLHKMVQQPLLLHKKRSNEL